MIEQSKMTQLTFGGVKGKPWKQPFYSLTMYAVILVHPLIHIALLHLNI